MAMSLVAFAVALVGFSVVGSVAQASTASSFESLTNSARAAAGLAPYTISSDLSAVALAQAQRMASSQKLYHNPSLATAVKNWSWVGENVGYGPSVTTLQNAFMNSPDHRANILDHQFTQVGVGAVTVNGTIWVSVVFRRPLHVTSTTARPKAKSTSKSTARRLSGVPAPVAARPSTPKRPATTVPAGVRCSASKLAAKQILGLAGEDHSVRLVQQSLWLVLGFQCGKGLPMTGLLDHDTLRALGA
jgi:hypothetical protein